MNDVKIRRMTTIAMLCAVAYVVMVVVKIPVVLFLKYEPKDVIIVIGGFLMGPLAAFMVSLVVSLVEMFTVSDTGIIGFVMNVLSSCAFACTASLIYKRMKNIRGAIFSLVVGTGVMVVIMLLWNYLITPLYMELPREQVVPLLTSAILPFNILKGCLNSAIVFLIYKPVVRGLRKANLVPSSAGDSNSKFSLFALLVALLVLATCVLIVLVLNNII